MKVLKRYLKGLVSPGLCALLCGALGAAGGAVAQDTPVPLLRAHSHNDYMRKQPLIDALNAGFCSVEADIYLVDGELLVAHDRDKCKPERTLQKLYLDPLLERVRKNGGKVYPNGPEVSLLIDFKGDPESTYAKLKEVLKPYEEMLTVFTPDSTENKAVMIVISGNTPRETIAAEPRRMVAIDGRPPDLDNGMSKNVVPWVSSSWLDSFTWIGKGDMPEAEREKLAQMIKKAHDKGQRIRFWAYPGTEVVWSMLYDAGIDLINADNVVKLQAFLLQRMK